MNGPPAYLLSANTYAAPTSVLLTITLGAPETIVVPFALTEAPNSSFCAPLEAVSSAANFEVFFQPDLGLT